MNWVVKEVGGRLLTEDDLPPKGWEGVRFEVLTPQATKMVMHCHVPENARLGPLVAQMSRSREEAEKAFDEGRVSLRSERGHAFPVAHRELPVRNRDTVLVRTTT